MTSPAIPSPKGETRDIVDLLTERRKLRYSGNCKCGKCCLVPHEMLCSAIEEIKRLRSTSSSEDVRRETLEAVGQSAVKYPGDDMISRCMDAGATAQLKAALQAIRALSQKE